MHTGARDVGADANALYRVGTVSHDEQQNGISVQLSIDFIPYFEWIDGTTPTSIASMEDVRGKMENAWYDLQGRQLPGKPTQKGIYTKDGIKMVVK